MNNNCVTVCCLNQYDNVIIPGNDEVLPNIKVYVIHIIRVALHLLDHIEIVIAQNLQFRMLYILKSPKVTKNFHAFALQERLNAIPFTLRGHWVTLLNKCIIASSSSTHSAPSSKPYLPALMGIQDCKFLDLKPVIASPSSIPSSHLSFPIHHSIAAPSSY